jgi:hypothetical protein
VTYFEELSEYRYHTSGVRAGTLTVGWLDVEHRFEKAPPSSTLLDILWEYCKVSTVQTRGIHQCNICDPSMIVLASRNGEPRRLLGDAEIRVFAEDGRIYAAPTLIYHYVRAHEYKPPDEFLRAIRREPLPPTSPYLDQLRKLDLSWNSTPQKEDVVRFRFERVNGTLEKVQVQSSVHIDED